ncbi:MAG: hypothetical protein KAX11_07795 [Candidatus Aminicenantes bacterium]|nr:hypothetical protein [Candidatus Aminicenantes bacterium]
MKKLSASKKNRRASRHQEKGAVMVMALFLSVTLLLIATPSLFKLLTLKGLTEKSHKTLAALNLAEAGIDRAIWELNSGDISNWSGDSQIRTFSFYSFQPHGGGTDGNVLISVLDPFGETPFIESAGQISSQPSIQIGKAVRVMLKEREIPFFDFGVFGNESVTIASNLNILGSVGTNGTSAGSIFVASNSTVDGDIICGPGGDPEVALDIDENSSVSGLIDSAAEFKDFPDVIVPEDLPYRGNVEISNDTLTIFENGDYSSLVIGQNSQLVISGDVILHVSGLFSLGSNTELLITEGSSLTLYLSGSLDMNSNCSVNNANHDSTKLKFYGTEYLDNNIQFDSNATFHGVVYMPYADLTISSNIDFYGSVYGRNIYLNANVYVSYQEGHEDFSSRRYEIKSWQEIRH